MKFHRGISGKEKNEKKNLILGYRSEESFGHPKAISFPKIMKGKQSSIVSIWSSKIIIAFGPSLPSQT